MSTERPWAPQQKADKSTVFYERSSSPNDRCGRCCYFLGATCDLVEGPISPNAVCRRFELPKAAS